MLTTVPLHNTNFIPKFLFEIDFFGKLKVPAELLFKRNFLANSLTKEKNVCNVNTFLSNSFPLSLPANTTKNVL